MGTDGLGKDRWGGIGTGHGLGRGGEIAMEIYPRRFFFLAAGSNHKFISFPTKTSPYMKATLGVIILFSVVVGKMLPGISVCQSIRTPDTEHPTLSNATADHLPLPCHLPYIPSSSLVSPSTHFSSSFCVWGGCVEEERWTGRGAGTWR